ncbi:hypothetical protein OPV22_018657 [Ensete ventricosum]|uniref:Uncharacterized protein n=1 Tax=Ensete ventricosum TaxID=4639 RepID=A0AAV8R0T6_ENSVE|nr:hypothetical protein OPV22_018657 [Ensete ventricosum]
MHLAVKMHDDVSGGLEQCFGSDSCIASTMILSYAIEGTGLSVWNIFEGLDANKTWKTKCPLHQSFLRPAVQNALCQCPAPSAECRITSRAVDMYVCLVCPSSLHAQPLLQAVFLCPCSATLVSSPPNLAHAQLKQVTAC